MRHRMVATAPSAAAYLGKELAMTADPAFLAAICPSLGNEPGVALTVVPLSSTTSTPGINTALLITTEGTYGLGQ
jgi:hypothetical protein